MARIKGALATRKRRNKVLKLAKGYWGGKSRLFKTAKEAVWKSGKYAYISRRLKKRDFRKLWITRISAACKLNGMNYSTFINGLKKANISLNRKMLSEIAINDAAGFTALCDGRDIFAYKAHLFYYAFSLIFPLFLVLIDNFFVNLRFLGMTVKVDNVYNDRG